MRKSGDVKKQQGSKQTETGLAGNYNDIDLKKQRRTRLVRL
tara:strand:+ start:1137 stop:1259 length:123 start_codon:yes stop_codon:yes gene_type:complete